MRKAGLTNDITSNDEPDYKQPFYQNIFRLMEGFSQNKRIKENEYLVEVLLKQVNQAKDVNEKIFEMHKKNI